MVTPMRIACWNVNSIRSRLDQLTAWLARAVPDVICLQETKVEDRLFPVQALEEVGYRSVYFGQKTYNGVSIAAKFGLAIEDVKNNLDSDDAEAPRRAIAATIEGIRVINVYVPNGQAVGTPAFAFKLAWFERFLVELGTHYSPDQELIVCGDFNVAPEPIDVHDPKRWEGQVLFHPDERAALKKILGWGLVDSFRAHHPEPGVYSWWDYRMGAFPRNRGLRIDLALLTRPLAARCTDVTIDRRPRELDRPSDHAPVVVEID
jgi:exodeoxyribonuclease-3